MLLENFALTHLRQDNLDLALEYYHESLDLVENREAHHYTNVAKAKYKIGFVLMKQGKYIEAERYLNDSIGIYESANNNLYDDSHAKCHIDYGHLCLLQGRHAESLNHFHKATSFRYKSDDVDHKDIVCESWLHIGEILMTQGKYDEATSCLEKSASLRRPQSSMTTKSHAMIYFRLGLCYRLTIDRVGIISHYKAHKEFVKALLLFSSPSAENDYRYDILKVAAQIFDNWRIWRDTVSI